MHNIYHDETERKTQISWAESDKTYDISLLRGCQRLSDFGVYEKVVGVKQPTDYDEWDSGQSENVQRLSFARKGLEMNIAGAEQPATEVLQNG